MRRARRLITAWVVLGLSIALTGSAQTWEGVTWITIERSVAEQANAAFAAAGEGALAIEGEGNIVVAPLSEADLGRLSAWVHRTLRHCGGFVGHPAREDARARAARTSLGPPPPRVPDFDYTIDNSAVVQALMAGIQEINVRNRIASLSAFTSRYHNCDSGKASAGWIWRLWTRYARGNPGVTVQFFNHTGYTTKQPSVILTIPGTGLPSEVVVLGAHQDSTVGGGCGLAPGADDDASGVASLTEVIRTALAQGYQPLRTVKFMAYAAEEVGLRGSDQIAETFQQQGVNVVGVLQLDMTGYEGSASDIYLINDYTNAAQNAFLGSLIDTYLPGLTRGTTVCEYACSDHASWHTRGYAASFPFEAYLNPFPPAQQSNPLIHTIGDTLANMGGDADHAVKFSKLAAAYMAELAKGTLQ